MLGYTKFYQVAESGSNPFPLLPDDHADASAQPPVQIFKVTLHVGQPKVIHPTVYQIIYLPYPIVKADTPASFCQFLQLTLKFLN